MQIHAELHVVQKGRAVFIDHEVPAVHLERVLARICLAEHGLDAPGDDVGGVLDEFAVELLSHSWVAVRAEHCH